MRSLLMFLCCCLAPEALAYTGFDADFGSDAGSAAAHRASYLLAGISEAVYDGGQTQNAHWRALGVERIGFKRAGQHDAQAVILKTDRYLIVAARGTRGATDMVQDARVTKGHVWSKDRLKVHDGFGDGAKALYGWARKTIRAHQGNRKLWLTGHSLGGALANLLAYRLERDAGITVAGVMTFGAPHVSGSQWQNKFNARFKGRSWRWINQHDPVTHMPAGSAWKGVGTRNVIRMEKSSAWKTACTLKCKRHRKKKKRKTCRDRCKKKWNKHDPKLRFGANNGPRGDLSQINDHRMPGYLRRIWKGMPSDKRGALPAPNVIDPR